MSRLYVKCFLLRKNIFCQKVIEILSSIGIDVERVVLRTLVAALTILQLTCSIRKVFAWKMLLPGKFSLFLNLPHCSMVLITITLHQLSCFQRVRWRCCLQSNCVLGPISNSLHTVQFSKSLRTVVSLKF